MVGQEVHGSRDVHLGWEAQQEVELVRHDLLLHEQHLERHLHREDELVLLEQTARGVDEHRVRDAVDQVQHARLHVLGRLRALDRLAEDHGERLRSAIDARPSAGRK